MWTKFAAAVALSLSPMVAHADAETAWSAYRQRDYARALAELRPLAARGDPAAQYYLASIYLDGSAVRRSAATAVALLEPSAQSGYAPAQFTLGLLLHNGSVAVSDRLAPDQARAMPWLLKAAQAGSPAANDLVGRAYQQGDALPRDLVRARQHLAVAANAGIGSAQVALAALLGAEPGAPNAIEAYKWLLIAAAAKYPGAVENLDVVGHRLNVMEIQQAHALAAAFKPLAP